MLMGVEGGVHGNSSIFSAPKKQYYSGIPALGRIQSLSIRRAFIDYWWYTNESVDSRQEELLNVHTVVSSSQVLWNHSYSFSHILVSKQFKCRMAVQIQLRK